MKDEITVKLTIASRTLSAKKLDELLGLHADSSQIMGDINRLGTKTYPQHAWILKGRRELTDEVAAEQMETHVSEFLDRLAVASPTIGTYARRIRSSWGFTSLLVKCLLSVSLQSKWQR